MKNILSFFSAFVLLGVFAPKVWAYDFSATAPNGQTLYYQIRTDGTSVNVVWPNSSATTNDETWTGFTKPTGNLVIPSTVTYNGTTYTVKGIGTAFYQCTGLTHVTIPATITAISNNVFNGCTGLTSISLGNGLKSIGRYVFYNCSSLTSITIPRSVTFIDIGAFWNCSSLTSVVFNADSCTTSGGYGTVYDMDLKGAFEGCNNITNFTFGDSVTIIPGYLCVNLTGLTSITIPNSVNSIGFCTFFRCIGLTSVTIPNSVTSIGDYTFAVCAGLTSVTIPNSVTSIGDYTFAYCYGLTSVTISNSVTSIGDHAFDGCHGLTSVTIPNSVTSIGKRAFSNCSNLTSVTIGSGTTTIKGAAFYNTDLTEIHSLSPIAPQLETYTEDGQVYEAFTGVTSSIPVYIPCGSSNSYYSRWSYFSNFVEDESFTFTATSANNQQGIVQILTMPTCTSPQAVIYASANSGYHFDHWSDNNTANPYSLTVTDDLDLVAYFAADGGGTEGIDDIDAANIHIYSEAGRIMVEGTIDEVNVYDITGRSVRNNNLSAGVYMVKVGDIPARRVVVVR